ncbi:MAG: LAGLIDADG family homing endonuclease [bacterium]|nr:LAGLIDADG family homing endonuclease [bacterium]
MAETIKDGRVKFRTKKDQCQFFLDVEVRLKQQHRTWGDAARELGITPRTLLTWRRADYLPTLSALKKLEVMTGVITPNYQLLPFYWSTGKAAKLGGKAVLQRYGRVPVSEAKRRKNWQRWWKIEGNKLANTPIGKTKEVILPPRSADTAEWVGIVMGDGGITSYQITITSHSEDDYQYQQFLVKFIYKLFGVHASTTFSKNVKAVSTKISRKLLVDYCVSRLGLITGNKVQQQVCIPLWIKNGSRSIFVSCLRGLFDTDGSVYYHIYSVNNKSYCYTKLAFTSASPKLANDFWQLLDKVGIKSRRTRNCRDVVIDSKEMVKKYFEIIGTHNPKHLKRYRSQPILSRIGEVA